MGVVPAWELRSLSPAAPPNNRPHATRHKKHSILTHDSNLLPRPHGLLAAVSRTRIVSCLALRLATNPPRRLSALPCPAQPVPKRTVRGDLMYLLSRTNERLSSSCASAPRTFGWCPACDASQRVHRWKSTVPCGPRPTRPPGRPARSPKGSIVDAVRGRGEWTKPNVHFGGKKGALVRFGVGVAASGVPGRLLAVHGAY